VIDTGDRIEGNGLYDASDPRGIYTREIFKEQHIDVICSGNHELYKQNSSVNEYLDMVPNFKGKYLASNLDILDPTTGERVPLAQRFRKFKTKNQGIRIIAFGFIFDFTGNYENTFVQPVENTVQEDWFQEAIRDREVDLFLVTGHVAIRSEEYTQIYKAIREVQGDVPIQFFGGHTHIRDYKIYDSKSYALESGRYMETIGFQSISGIATPGNGQGSGSSRGPLSFARRYIDNNLFSYYHHTSKNSSTFPTDHGRKVSSAITSARKALNLDHKLGCAPHDLWANRVSETSNSSIFQWLKNEVIPDKILNVDKASLPRIAMINTGSMRFDIFQGPFTIDTTFIVSPFSTGFRQIKGLPYTLANRTLSIINNYGQVLEEAAPWLKLWMLAPPEQIGRTQQFTSMPPGLLQALGSQIRINEEPGLTPGYTTKDDGGDDGDDTIHSPISFYNVPNCIEARAATTVVGKDGVERPVETVDLIYLEFIQPWILLALWYQGMKLRDVNTEPYLDGKDFTGLIAEWIQDNWKGEC
jgi:hypothetical protein